MLVERLLSHERLINSFKTFYGRYQDLVVKYHRSVSDIVRDSFPSDTLSKYIVTFLFFKLDLSLGLSTHLFHG